MSSVDFRVASSVYDAAPPEPPAFEGRQGYERFREQAVIPQLFEMSTDPERFHSRLAPQSIGAVTVIGYDMAPARYSRTAQRARRDGVDHVWLQLVAQGGLSAWSSDQTATLSPGSAALCDFSVSTEQVSLASKGVAVLIPRDAFARFDVAALHGASVHGSRFALLKDHLAWLRAAPPSASRSGRTARTLAAVVAACLTPDARPSEEAAGELGAAVARRARAYMIENLTRPGLSSAEVARAVGVSRSTLYRCCAPHGGVAEMLWAARVEAARTALTDPNRPGRIGDIAAACGFSFLQHFSRRFRDRYGFSPSNLRPF